MSALDYATAALALCVVIMLHEGGHYVTAVWSGMKVDRFSVFGIGPAILKLGTWRGTEFVIGAIPFGAYVLIRGMEAEEDPPPAGTPTDPSSFNFRDKPIAKRALTIAGGPIANYIVAFFTFLAVFSLYGVKQPPQAIAITSFGEDSPAQAAGAELGDEVIRIAGLDIDPALGGNDVKPAATAHRGSTIPMVVRRDGEELQLQLAVPKGTASPLSVRMEGVRFERADVPFATAVGAAFEQPIEVSKMQLQGLKSIFQGEVSTDRVGGPVEIVRTVAGAAAVGLPDFLEMVAIISTLLGLFNLLPLPALDGGRLTFLAYEAIAKRRANPRIEEAVHGYGMLLLLSLILLVTIGDIRRLL
ncbi:MAG: M50 family metallopeptidase [Nannocystales bacterium]